MINSQIQQDIDFLIADMKSLEIAPVGRVLITGGSGMLGSYIAQGLLELKNRSKFGIESISLLIRENSSRFSMFQKFFGNKFEYIHQNSLLQLQHKFSFDTIIHAASPSNFRVIKLSMMSLFQTNLEMTLQLQKLLAPNVGRFIFFSSGDVYGPNPHFPTSEEDFSGFNHTNPKYLYAEFKRAAESLMYISSQETGLTNTSLRIYHTFGPGVDLSDTRIFGSVVNTLVTKSPFIWNSSGTAKRNFLYSKDLLLAILLTTNSHGFEAYNVAGDESIFVKDFVSIARSLSSVELFPMPPIGSMEEDAPISIGEASTLKLKSLNWRQTVPTEQAVSNTLASFMGASSRID